MNQIDILLATYNGEKYLSEQIESILNQTHEEWILRIRDDGSTDKTVEIISTYTSKYPDKIALIKDSEKNLGATLNFSRLMEKSDAEYIMFCDQDDIWMNNKIEITLAKMKELETEYSNTVPLMVFSDLTVVDEKLNEVEKSFWNFQKIEPNISKNLYEIMAQNVVTGCTMMFNNKALTLCKPIPTKDILHDHWVAVNVCQHDSNELGAIGVDFKYFVQQIKYIMNNIGKYQNKYGNFPFKVNYLLLIWTKIYLNLRRF
jgi:glycosyltransferase involved in cell wall biosynthesis